MLTDFKDKKILIMGLGLHGGGVATAKFFADQKAEVIVTDLKIDDELTPSLAELKKYDIRYVLGRHDEENFKSADLVIKNPGVPDDSEYLEIARKNSIPIDTALGVFWRLCPSRDIIGITGTKGKSTTTSLIYSIIKETRDNVVLAGNIRISPLEVLPKIKEDTTVILELSSWNLDDLRQHKVSPRIAVITNIFPDHLDRYKTLDNYIASKKNIFSFQKQSDHLILNYDNPILNHPRFHLGLPHIHWVSSKEELPHGTFIKDGQVICNTNGFFHTMAEVGDIQIKGQHNQANALAAIAAVSIWGAKRTQIRQALKKFNGVSDRQEFLKEAKGVRYYNDTTATTPDATEQALKTLEGPLVLIAGGADKGLEYIGLAQTIKNSEVKKLILFKGAASDKLTKELERIGFLGSKIETDITSMPLAFSKALDNAKTGDAILLSPGAASFGLFKNEFDRGDQFKSLVNKLN